MELPRSPPQPPPNYSPLGSRSCLPFQAAYSSRTSEPSPTSIYIILGIINACEAATSGKNTESTGVKASSRGLIRQLTSKLARRRWQDAGRVAGRTHQIEIVMWFCICSWRRGFVCRSTSPLTVNLTDEMKVLGPPWMASCCTQHAAASTAAYKCCFPTSLSAPDLNLQLHMQWRPVTTRVLQIYSLLIKCKYTERPAFGVHTHARICIRSAMPDDVHRVAFSGLDSPTARSLHGLGQGLTFSRAAFKVCFRAR